LLALQYIELDRPSAALLVGSYKQQATLEGIVASVIPAEKSL